MNRLNILFLFIIFNTDSLHCMKRTQNSSTVISCAKRPKTSNHSPIESSSPFLTGDTSMRSLEYNNQKLVCALKIYNDATVQNNYIDAIQTRDTDALVYWLYQKPRDCHLESIVGLNFTAGAYAVLQHAQPIQVVLNASLEMAIIHKNIIIMNALLEKGARLTSKMNSVVKKVLNDNPEIKEFVCSYGKELMNQDKSFQELVRTLLKNTKPQQHVLNEYLNIAAQQQNLPLATLLIEAGADINSCIN